ncbi:glutamine--scyllo-inositol aminotransferase [Pokkaliibacter plantistimulans]|uniref:Glutamine--scyllo-inositol aminotransferase n=1 Tax=Pokkaliibacter plantistimulans TaxID=1635171 RepID=A0ABX5M0G3_9GAMM|nr:DegT/DnrJ/EryC1/StrS family aminotransferase [Pokkaliibacter plantistimulans]PXF32377.1 glutamine--scyllo-inositol aminotransferase [Pokkaliibacter plantistimulans]
MNERIAYTRPSITALEVGYATDAAANGWGSHCYDYIHKFEQLFCQHLGVRYAIATSSCTGALHMGMAALGIGEGDEVILADTNWVATVSPVVQLGATPVFVDILPDSWCLDPEQVEAAITPKTRAIIAVHLYGNLCDMDKLLALGEKHGIPVIEDAAEAIGSVWQGMRAGAMGRFGAFSFHGTKTITTGEGGIFVTNDPELYETVLTLSNHGRARGQTRQFWPEMMGFKYKMSNIQAAIGCGQLERIEELIQRKQQIMANYRQALMGVSCIQLNPEQPGATIGAWMPNAVFDKESGITDQALIQAFQAANIDARPFFAPLSTLPMFAGAFPKPVAVDIAGRSINLPSYHDMTHQQQERIVQVLAGMA